MQLREGFPKFLFRILLGGDIQQQAVDVREVPLVVVQQLAPVREPAYRAVPVHGPVFYAEDLISSAHGLPEEVLHVLQVVRVDQVTPLRPAVYELLGGVAGDPLHVEADEGEGPVPQAPVDDAGDVVHEGEKATGHLLVVGEHFLRPLGLRDIG